MNLSQNMMYAQIQRFLTQCFSAQHHQLQLIIQDNLTIIFLLFHYIIRNTYDFHFDFLN